MAATGETMALSYPNRKDDAAKTTHAKTRSGVMGSSRGLCMEATTFNDAKDERRRWTSRFAPPLAPAPNVALCRRCCTLFGPASTGPCHAFDPAKSMLLRAHCDAEGRPGLTGSTTSGRLGSERQTFSRYLVVTLGWRGSAEVMIIEQQQQQQPECSSADAGIWPCN